VVPSHLAPTKLPKYHFSWFFYATRSLEITKVSLLSCFPPALRPRCSKSVTTYRFSTRLRPRSYQSVVRHRSYQSGATFMFPSHPAPSKLPKYHYSSFFYASRSREVTKVSLPSCSSPILRPRSCQSTSIHCFFKRPAASKFPKSRYFRVPIPLFSSSYTMNYSSWNILKNSVFQTLNVLENWLTELFCVDFISYGLRPLPPAPDHCSLL